MESAAFEVLQKARNKQVRVLTLNSKTYRGVLENFDMNVNTHLRDSYVKSDEDEEMYVGEVLINGGAVACIDII